MVEVCNYDEFSQEQINATILKLENELANYILLAARQDLVGNCSKAEAYALEAEKIAQKIHTLEGICPTPLFTYVDKSISLSCGGTGIGFWAIGGNLKGGSLRGCEAFTIKGKTAITTPPPYGEFRYCSFRTNSFTEVTGGPPPTCN